MLEGYYMSSGTLLHIIRNRVPAYKEQGSIIDGPKRWDIKHVANEQLTCDMRFENATYL